MSSGSLELNRGVDPRPCLRGVIFDMDGVLVDSHAAHREAWRLFLQSLGRHVPDSELDFILDGRKRIDILRRFLGDLPEPELEEFGRRKDSIFREVQPGVVPVPGAIRLVRELRGQGIGLAVATSASRSRARSTLLDLGLLNYFDAVVTAEDVNQGKPNPAIYRAASERLGLPLHQMLAVEDAVSGIQSAVAAGLACVAVAMHESPLTLLGAGASHVVAHFETVSPAELEGVLLGNAAALSDPGSAKA